MSSKVKDLNYKADNILPCIKKTRLVLVKLHKKVLLCFEKKKTCIDKIPWCFWLCFEKKKFVLLNCILRFLFIYFCFFLVLNVKEKKKSLKFKSFSLKWKKKDFILETKDLVLFLFFHRWHFSTSCITQNEL